MVQVCPDARLQRKEDLGVLGGRVQPLDRRCQRDALRALPGGCDGGREEGET